MIAVPLSGYWLLIAWHHLLLVGLHAGHALLLIALHSRHPWLLIALQACHPLLLVGVHRWLLIHLRLLHRHTLHRLLITRDRLRIAGYRKRGRTTWCGCGISWLER